MRAALARKDFTLARELCAQLLDREPKNAAALHCAGLAWQGLGDMERAISCLRRSVSIDTSAAEVRNDLGAAYLKNAWYAEAEDCFRAAIALAPAHASYHANLGAVMLAHGRLGESRRAYQRSFALRLRAALPSFLRWKIALPPPGAEALPAGQAAQVRRMLGEGSALEALAAAQALARIAPRNAQALELLGAALAECGETARAAEALEAAVAARPDHIDAHLGLARCYSRLGQLDEAAASAGAALRLDPASADVLGGISGIFHPWDDERAELYARRALELAPELGAAHTNLAAALWGQGRLEEAESHCREALRLNPALLVNQLNLALILRHRGRIGEAQALYHALEPAAAGNARLCIDVGNLALSCGNLEQARPWYRRAQSLTSDAQPRFVEAILDLLQGDFAVGWERYEARKRTLDLRWHQPYARFPAWGGEPLGGERLLVYGEQGLGDEIMFASMLADVQQRAPQVRLICDQRLGPLFARSFPAFEVISEALERRAERVGAMDDIDRHIASGSLGRLFRRQVEDFPRHHGYLVPDPLKVAAWRTRLDGFGPGLKVGISWQGGVQGTGRATRSMALETLAPVLEQPGVHWASLQHGAKAAAGIAEFEGVTRDLDELAALVAALDLVISVCNTTVHVAGAIGKEVWVMAPLVPEWRYGIRGEGMIWYPSARVLRQERYADWSGVVGEVARRLRDRVSARPAPAKHDPAGDPAACCGDC